MPQVFVLFDLKHDTDVQEYERWAVERDVPTVRKLASVDRFSVHRIDGALAGESPYRYVEIVQVNDMERFKQEIQSEEMQAIAAEFQALASDPMFIFGEEIA